MALFAGLDPVPGRVHFLQAGLRDRAAALGQRVLDRLKAAHEFPVGGVEEKLGLVPAFSRQVHHGEEQVANFFSESLCASLGEGGLDFVHLLAHLGQHFPGLRPVEADRGGLALELGRREQGGLSFVGLFQQVVPVRRRGRAPCSLFLLPGLDGLPLAEDGIRAVGHGVAEDVGMTPHQFLADGTGDLVDVEVTRLGGDGRVEKGLEQQIAQLVDERRAIAGTDGGADFVGLLDGVADEAFMGLFGIPRTSAGRPEHVHDLAETFERGQVGRRDHGRVVREGRKGKDKRRKSCALIRTTSPMAKHRFYLSVDQWNPECLLLEGEEAHHCVSVMRCRVGERVLLFNGRGGMAEAEIVELGRDRVRLEAVQSVASPAPAVSLTLAQAVPKGKNMDLIVQKATELGATRIVPLLTERSVVHLEAGELGKKQQKWQRVAIEACKQCGQNWLPEVVRPIRLGDYLEAESAPLRLVAALNAATRPLKAILSSFEQLPREASVLIGPEGDFTEAEVALAQARGFLPLSLGDLVLRSETAAIYSLSILGHELNAR